MKTLAESSAMAAQVERRFAQWLAAGGASHALRVQSCSATGWGLEARLDVAKGAALATLPPAFHLTVDSLPQPKRKQLQHIVNAVDANQWQMKVGLVVLAHRAQGLSSFYQPYLETLPSRFSLPAFWSPEEVQALDYAPLVHELGQNARYAVQFCGERLGARSADCFEGAEIDPGALIWAASVVSSRAFRFGALAQQAGSMLPFMDIANHSFAGSNAEQVLHADGSIVMRAARDIQAGEPVLISYGHLDNTALLRDYGFVDDDNPYERVALMWSPSFWARAREAAGLGHLPFGDCDEKGGASAPEAVLPLPWQSQVLRALGLEGEAGDPRLNPGLMLGRSAELSDGRLLAALRVMFTPSESDASKRTPADLTKAGKEGALGQIAEVAMNKTIGAAAKLAAEHFVSSVEEDDAAVARGLGDNMELALRFRAAKKRCLRDVEAWSRQAASDVASGHRADSAKAAQGGGWY